MTSPPNESTSPRPLTMRAPSTKSRTAPVHGREGPLRAQATAPPMVEAAPWRGGSNASHWPCSASAACVSATRVPARTVSTSSLGSWLTMPRCSPTRRGSPAGARPRKRLVPPPSIESGAPDSNAARTRPRISSVRSATRPGFPLRRSRPARRYAAAERVEAGRANPRPHVAPASVARAPRRRGRPEGARPCAVRGPAPPAGRRCGPRPGISTARARGRAGCPDGRASRRTPRSAAGSAPPCRG